VIVVEQAAETLTTANPTGAHAKRVAVDELVVDALVIAFVVVMLDELVQGPSEMPLLHRNHSVAAFVLD